MSNTAIGAFVLVEVAESKGAAEAAGAPQQLPSSEASGDSTVLNDLDVQLETLPSLPADFALGTALFWISLCLPELQ